MDTIRVPLAHGRSVLIDSEDLVRVAEFKWHTFKIGNTWYAATHAGGKRIYLHRLVMDAPEGTMVDHVNLSGLDDRKSNLRFCTKAQNMWNVPAPRTNTSGFKGVRWFKPHRLWVANVRHNGRQIHIGYFHAPEEAHAAYVAKVRELKGEFARVA